METLHSHAPARIPTPRPTAVMFCVKGLLSLGYACKKFYLSSTIVVKDILPNQRAAGYNGVEGRGKRLAFLCMLGRDQQISKSKLVCSSCIKV